MKQSLKVGHPSLHINKARVIEQMWLIHHSHDDLKRPPLGGMGADDYM